MIQTVVFHGYDAAFRLPDLLAASYPYDQPTDHNEVDQMPFRAPVSEYEFMLRHVSIMTKSPQQQSSKTLDWMLLMPF